MSTVHKLVNDGVLKPYELAEDDPRLLERYIHGTIGFLDWYENILPGLTSDFSAIAPSEQVEDLFDRFVCGDQLVFGRDIKTLVAVGAPVWAMKAVDVRIFGFFYRRSCFIAVGGAAKRSLRKASLYRPHIADVQAAITSLDLDPPKFIGGSLLSNVL